MEIEIKKEHIDSYLSSHSSEIPEKENYKYTDGDIVKYNDSYYVLKNHYGNVFGYYVFDLYSLDNKKVEDHINLDKIELVITKDMYSSLYEEKKKEKEEEEKEKKEKEEEKKEKEGSSSSSSISSGGGYSGGGGGGGYSKSRTSKSYDTTDDTDIESATKDLESTEKLDKKLGSKEKTKRTVESCQQMINKAQDAIKTNNITVNKWEDTKNADGYAAQASIVFLNNLSSALTTLESNLDKTKLSALEVNDLNENVKELLVDFVEKEEKEEQKKSKETTLQSMSPTTTVTNADGTTTQKENEAYKKLQNEISELATEIDKIDKDIEELQVKIDDKYNTIQTKYGNLLNFNSFSNVSITGNTIFGKGGNTKVDAEIIDGEVIKNYMLSNKLEYFEYGNSIYNIASPFDPWTNKKLNLEEKYLIKYDLIKLQNLANKGNEVAKGAIQFMKGKASGKINVGVRHFITGSEKGKYYYYSDGGYKPMSYTWKKQIPEVMDNVLNDSYKANGCKTVTDYATTSMMVMTGGIFNGQYGGGARPMEVGTSGIIGGSVCISAVNWAEAQGLIKAEGKTNIKPLGLGYGIRTMSDSWDGKSILPVGTVVTSKSLHDFHIGIIIGHTTIDGVKYNVVGQTGNRQNGYNAHVLIKTTFDTQISSEKLKSAYCA